jgi:hypothetical protein
MVYSIGNVDFKHWEANHAARVCFSDNNSCNWVDEPPIFLLSELLNDVIIISN